MFLTSPLTLTNKLKIVKARYQLPVLLGQASLSCVEATQLYAAALLAGCY